MASRLAEPATAGHGFTTHWRFVRRLSGYVVTGRDRSPKMSEEWGSWRRTPITWEVAPKPMARVGSLYGNVCTERRRPTVSKHLRDWWTGSWDTTKPCSMTAFRRAWEMAPSMSK